MGRKERTNTSTVATPPVDLNSLEESAAAEDQYSRNDDKFSYSQQDEGPHTTMNHPSSTKIDQDEDDDENRTSSSSRGAHEESVEVADRKPRSKVQQSPHPSPSASVSRRRAAQELSTELEEKIVQKLRNEVNGKRQELASIEQQLRKIRRSSTPSSGSAARKESSGGNGHRSLRQDDEKSEGRRQSETHTSGKQEKETTAAGSKSQTGIKEPNPRLTKLPKLMQERADEYKKQRAEKESGAGTPAAADKNGSGDKEPYVNKYAELTIPKFAERLHKNPTRELPPAPDPNEKKYIAPLPEESAKRLCHKRTTRVDAIKKERAAEDLIRKRGPRRLDSDGIHDSVERLTIPLARFRKNLKGRNKGGAAGRGPLSSLPGSPRSGLSTPSVASLAESKKNGGGDSIASSGGGGLRTLHAPPGGVQLSDEKPKMTKAERKAYFESLYYEGVQRDKSAVEAAVAKYAKRPKTCMDFTKKKSDIDLQAMFDRLQH